MKEANTINIYLNCHNVINVFVHVEVIFKEASIYIYEIHTF